MRLKDKVAVITGSARGMGKADALLLASEGAKVVVNDLRNVEEGHAVAEKIVDGGGEAIFTQADVSDPDSVKMLFQETVNTYGTVDVLVNNAGILKAKPFVELTKEDWERTLAVNLIGLFLCAQEAAKIMLQQESGRIINIASMRGIFNSANPNDMDYSASKAGVISLTKALAKELAPHINVNAIAPGHTATHMTANWNSERRDSALSKNILHRLVEPEEIAQAVLFLASDAASAITGEVLSVDAGFQLK